MHDNPVCHYLDGIRPIMVSEWDNQPDSLQHLFLKQKAACYDFYRSYIKLTEKTNVEYKTYLNWSIVRLMHVEDTVWLRIFESAFERAPVLHQKWNEILIAKKKFEENGGIYPNLSSY